MATLKEPPEAAYKPPPKSKWSAAPAAPKCPACREGSAIEILFISISKDDFVCLSVRFKLV